MARQRVRPDGMTPPHYSPEESEPLDDPRLDAALAEWHALLDASGASYEAQASTARACAKVWHIRAELLARRNEHDAARKSSSTAAEQQQLAAKLDSSALVDRVAELERVLGQSRKDASSLASLK
jgi:hypothetical protein